MRDNSSETIETLTIMVGIAAAQSYLALVSKGLLTIEEAAAQLRSDATVYENPTLPEPLVGQAVANNLRRIAASWENRKDGTPPQLSLIEGGKTGEDL